MYEIMKWHIRLTKDIASMIPQAHPNIPPLQYIMTGVLVGLAEYLNMPVFLDFTKLIAPTGIFLGKIRTGKSTSAKAILYRQHLIYKTPILIFDVHGEYSEDVRKLGGTVIDMIHHTINPCKITDADTTTTQKALQLTDMFDTLFDLSDVQKAILIRYIKKGYEKFSDSLTFSLLTQMIEDDLEKRLPESKTLSALLLRFQNLAENIFGDENSISLDELTNGLVCIDVSKIENNHLRNMVMLAVLQHIYNTMLSKQKSQIYQPDGNIQLLIMIDEAGRIASSENSVATKLVKESGKFKIGLFFGIQDIPDIDSKILSNYGFVFIHKLDNQEYITKVKNDCSFSREQAERIRMLPVGTAFVKLNFKDASYQSPFLVRVQREDILLDQGESGSKPSHTSKEGTIRTVRTPHKVEKTTLPEKENLTELECKLLQSISEDDSLSTTQHYKRTDTNAYQGNRARHALESRGLIGGKYSQKKRILFITDSARKQFNLQNKTKRFGSGNTKSELDTIKSKLESLGHSVIREYSLGGGKQTDLVVNGHTAIEYDTETVREQNIRKNLQYGFNNVIQIYRDLSQASKFLRQIDELELEGHDRDKITVVDYNTFLSEQTMSRLVRKGGDRLCGDSET